MRAFIIFAALMLISTPASADRFALTYDGFGLGFVPVGGVTVDADVTDESYDISATVASRGILNLFERTDIDASAAGIISAGTPRWQRYDLDHRYSGKRRTISMQADGVGAITSQIEPEYRTWGDPAATEEQRRASRDPLSSIVAMSIDVGRSRRCEGTYPTFDGRFHYLLQLGGGDIDAYDGGGFEGEVLKCSLSYIAISGFNPRDQGRRRIPEGQVWFALMPDTTFAPPVRISTPLSAGGATIRLASFRRARVDVQYTSDTPTPP
ncbi:DUF3108 domain-containing protein [Candidatus Viadribacter manganicus]|uniref:DUF3108 domain-containing protein n=1 Tax=Candidatus Viadribacter manganicus TaxID=1759059 RepID=A0A1B1AJ60_9PROT|nr:DUF3108 domain-containing protein [Candidatus Viadribacter manganicus]ANP46585.1 hypothetical protein ATE48_11990 [Candidatus Viadribacter manganicus]